MLQAIFGTGDKKKPNPKGPAKDAKGRPIVLTTSVFDTLFGGPTQLKRKH